MRLKVAGREEGNDFLTWNDIQACVDQVNNAVHEEHQSEYEWNRSNVELSRAGTGSAQRIGEAPSV